MINPLTVQLAPPPSQHFPPEERSHPEVGSGLPKVTQVSTGTATSAQGFLLHDVSARKGKV